MSEIIWAIKYSWIRLRKKCATPKKFLCLFRILDSMNNFFPYDNAHQPTNQLTKHTCSLFLSLVLAFIFNKCQWIDLYGKMWPAANGNYFCAIDARVNYSLISIGLTIENCMVSAKKWEGQQSKYTYNIPFRMLNGSCIFVFGAKAQKCPYHWHGWALLVPTQASISVCSFSHSSW